MCSCDAIEIRTHTQDDIRKLDVTSITATYVRFEVAEGEEEDEDETQQRRHCQQLVFLHCRLKRLLEFTKRMIYLSVPIGRNRQQCGRSNQQD